MHKRTQVENVQINNNFNNTDCLRSPTQPAKHKGHITHYIFNSFFMNPACTRALQPLVPHSNVVFKESQAGTALIVSTLAPGLLAVESLDSVFLLEILQRTWTRHCCRWKRKAYPFVISEGGVDC